MRTGEALSSRPQKLEHMKHQLGRSSAAREKGRRFVLSKLKFE